MQTLRTAALQFPEAQEGIACAGTSLEKRTINARNKAFLFLGVADAMLKLRDSLAEANDLAAKEPGRYKVGAHGWVNIAFGEAQSLPVDVLVRWVEESYRLLAPKPLAAMLPAGNLPTARKTPAVKALSARPKRRVKKER